MINDIVGLICTEARSWRRLSSFDRNLIDVTFEVNKEILDILDRLRDERRQKEDEDKR
ncbi:unnamed protein product [marine sediment metagenome]|uniref:Uncharacterized protein n=1 Tax=marine sediment metagenome TaxID=412755 RepID=X1FGL1_9ZZZZ